MTIETKRIYKISKEQFHGVFQLSKDEPSLVAVIEYDNKLIKVELYQVEFIEEEQND
ncbi:hypothetical protein M3554_12245 [Staphylococcus warneri]|uniref:hypothetical protein n=2 Tax=Staphylococcus warneri TaxID=1292 RepID=UPI001AED88A2|nr:hypothetical protein [Staphylococcus warneri]MBP3034162.1 hypothetical protein [Staphylococcus warneri]MCM3071014.1 hypothetical protein [Staphylococcus warneri]